MTVPELTAVQQEIAEIHSDFTVEVGFIRGQRGSAWRNDAYTVYAAGRNGRQLLLGVVPAYEIKRLACPPETVQSVFTAAVADAGLDEKTVLHQVVKDRIDTAGSPRPGRMEICL